MELDYPLDDGTTLRNHLQQVEVSSGKKPKLLKEETFPEAGSWLWYCFWSINTSRAPDAGISYTEINSYSHLMRIDFSPWEVDAIKAMDVAYLSFMNEKSKK